MLSIFDTNLENQNNLEKFKIDSGRVARYRRQKFQKIKVYTPNLVFKKTNEGKRTSVDLI